jgi:hypothetical protein
LGPGGRKGEIPFQSTPFSYYSMKKYRLEGRGRRRFDTVLEYDTLTRVVSEETRTADAVICACCN